MYFNTLEIVFHLVLFVLLQAGLCNLFNLQLPYTSANPAIMKPTSFIIILLLASSSLFSQDIIKQLDGAMYPVKIVDLSKDSVYCRSVTGDSSFVLAKTSLHSLQYANGVRMNFYEAREMPADTAVMSQGDAIADANRYYTKYRAASTGTLISSMFFPLFGLIPAVACSSTTPIASNLDIPDPSKAADPAYNQAYAAQAKKIKSKKVWKNYGIGAGVGVGVRVAYVVGIIVLISSIAVE